MIFFCFSMRPFVFKGHFFGAVSEAFNTLLIGKLSQKKGPLVSEHLLFFKGRGLGALLNAFDREIVPKKGPLEGERLAKGMAACSK